MEDKMGERDYLNVRYGEVEGSEVSFLGDMGLAVEGSRRGRAGKEIQREEVDLLYIVRRKSWN
jgi:hypothetical protein